MTAPVINRAEMSRAEKWQRFQADLQAFAAAPLPLDSEGVLVRVTGLVLEARGVRVPVGSVCDVRSAGQPVTIVEFRDRWAERELKLCARDFVSLSPLQQTFVAFLTPA